MFQELVKMIVTINNYIDMFIFFRCDKHLFSKSNCKYVNKETFYSMSFPSSIHATVIVTTSSSEPPVNMLLVKTLFSAVSSSTWMTVPIWKKRDGFRVISHVTTVSL